MLKTVQDPPLEKTFTSFLLCFLSLTVDSTYDISDVPIAVIITGAVAGVILIAGLAYRLCSRKSRW